MNARTFTALFADLKGSTELLEAVDPEEGREIVEPLLRIMSDAVHRYEGYLVRTTGDGIFALFGAPVAYEDHPQRALYAALQMQQELHAYTKDRIAKALPALEARVGVHTGEIVAYAGEASGKIEYRLIGPYSESGFANGVDRATRLDCCQRDHRQALRGLFRAAQFGTDDR